MTMRTKLSSSLLLMVLFGIRDRLVDSKSVSLPDADDQRALFNDKWPAKQIPVRRYHQWGYSGAATSAQYVKGTSRGVGPREPKDDDYYYYDEQGNEEEYYYGPTSTKNDKPPSEQEFEYYDKIPKHSKSDGKGKGTVEKSTKHDDCDYYYEQEYEYEIRPEDMSDQESGHYYGKGARGGKGKGGKTKKSTKSSKKTKVCTDPPFEAPPTLSPYPTSNDSPSETPPEEPTSEPNPNAPSVFTPSPTDEDSVAVTLAAYALAYDVPNLRQPTREELDELQAVTNLYLENFFFNEFDGNSFTILDDFITELLEASFVQGLPIEVDYLSTARFNPFSTIIPSDAQLNSALVDAFTGLQMLDYEMFLNDELPEDNVFFGSTVVLLQEGDDEEQPDTTRSGIGITGITAAAVAFTLIVAALIIYKRRGDGAEPETDKLNKTSADGTVAGETFTGETYDGTASVSAASADYARRYQDEDHASEAVRNLGTIPEYEVNDNVSPRTWNGKHAQETEADTDAKNAFRGRISQVQSSYTLRSGVRLGSFEEIALQGPTHGGSTNSVMLETLSTSQEELMPGISGEELPRLGSTMQFSSSSSTFDSMDGGSPSLASSLSIRETSTRRPRTVAEIEALLSADLGSGTDKGCIANDVSKEEQSRRSTNRPRTVEEIESLLHTDLDDDSVLELPFSDEDETIDAEDE